MKKNQRLIRVKNMVPAVEGKICFFQKNFKDFKLKAGDWLWAGKTSAEAERTGKTPIMVSWEVKIHSCFWFPVFLEDCEVQED